MYCPGCGAENPEGNGYCGKCGAPLPSPEGDDEWSKQYGPSGFGGRVVSTRDGVHVETDYSILGWRERTRYPRWMVVGPIAIFLVALYIGSFAVLLRAVREPEFMAEYLMFGSGLLGFSVLVTFILYWVYFRKPKAIREQEARMAEVSGDLPVSGPSGVDSDYNRRM